MNSFNFNTPVNLELAQIAKERGDRLLGFGTKKYEPRRVCDYRSMYLSCGHTHDVRVAHYRKGDYWCSQCFVENLHSVAKSQGLTLVSMDIIQHGAERLYRRECGHTEVHSHQYLIKHKILECQECIRIEVENNLQKYNFTVVDKVKEGFKVSCNICKTETISRTNVARKGTPTCTPCFSKLIHEEAIRAGFTFIQEKEPKRVVTKSRTSLNRWYSCNTCGYVDNYTHIAMRMRNVTCDKCYYNMRTAEAALQGMEYLGHSEGMYHKYQLPCGCVRDYQPQAIKKGVWACKTHSNTHYHRPSGLYLIKIKTSDFSWLKFGYAKNLDIRLKGYGLPDKAESEVLIHITTETGYEALAIEKAIHSELAELRLDPTMMKRYMTNTGHTECYPVNASELILSKMKGLNGYTSSD